MRFTRVALPFSLLVLAAAAAACGDHAVTSPSPELPRVANATGGNQTDTTIGQTGNPNIPGKTVPAFTLLGTVAGRLAGADTLASERVNQATVTLLRINMSSPDSLQPTTVATVTTDAAGAFSFGTVPSGFYRLDAVGPAGSAYGAASTSIGPQTVTNVVVRIVLPRI